MVNMFSAKAFNEYLMKQKQPQTCVVFLRKVDKIAEEKVKGVQVPSNVHKIKREGLLEELWKICAKYANIFPLNLPKGLPPKRLGHEFKIDLELDTKLEQEPIYKLSPLELEEAKRQIEYMLEHSSIRPSELPWGAQVLFAPKKDGPSRSLRVCIDYYWLNKKIIRNRYPLPSPEEMMNRLGGAQVLSKIDLKSGYWQVPICEEGIPKTAFRIRGVPGTCFWNGASTLRQYFVLPKNGSKHYLKYTFLAFPILGILGRGTPLFRTRWDLFEFLVMLFGVINAPSPFMHLVQDVLHTYLDVFMVIFIDDILVYSKSTVDLAEHLRLIFERLRKHWLFGHASKCTLHANEVEFLGRWVMPRVLL